MSGSSDEISVIARRLGMPLGSIGPMRARCLQKLMDVFRTIDREDRL